VTIEPAPACVESFPRWLSDPEAVFERLQADIGWEPVSVTARTCGVRFAPVGRRRTISGA